MKLRIYIPSRARPTCPTYYALPPAVRKQTTIVVRSDEAQLYRAAGHKRLLVLPKGVEGLSATRQWILENAPGRFHAQLDDDIKSFNVKENDRVGQLRKLHPLRANLAFRWLEESLQTVVACGLAPRWNAGLSSSYMLKNYLLWQCFAYDVAAIRKLKARFDRVLYFQDKDFTLQVLRAGREIWISTKWSYNAGPERVAGGCSAAGRTLKAQIASAKKLAALHPGLCAPPVVKGDYVRTPTRWKKAFNYDQKVPI